MKKNVFGRQFKRDANERKALFKNLLTSLVLEERIKTTQAKAKAIKGAADKLITKAKKGGDNAYKLIHPDVNQPAVVKIISDIAPRFAKRQGGYTRIIKLGKNRVADNAPMAMIEWTDGPSGLAVKPTKKIKKVKPAKKAKVKSDQPQLTSAVATKKQPKMKEVVRKMITRQKKGQ